ncbi:MAG: hypothetical protein KDC18_09465 [Alphaproteobacteria bacterium]|nr:hypothetical protein [Alphaproteobacteria bacterium]MCB9930187.1 hypothetical protein [Alphaproteobacteria bacterium]
MADAGIPGQEPNQQATEEPVQRHPLWRWLRGFTEHVLLTPWSLVLVIWASCLGSGIGTVDADWSTAATLIQGRHVFTNLDWDWPSATSAFWRHTGGFLILFIGFTAISAVFYCAFLRITKNSQRPIWIIIQLSWLWVFTNIRVRCDFDLHGDAKAWEKAANNPADDATLERFRF